MVAQTFVEYSAGRSRWRTSKADAHPIIGRASQIWLARRGFARVGGQIRRGPRRRASVGPIWEKIARVWYGYKLVCIIPSDADHAPRDSRHFWLSNFAACTHPGLHDLDVGTKRTPQNSNATAASGPHPGKWSEAAIIDRARFREQTKVATAPPGVVTTGLPSGGRCRALVRTERLRIPSQRTAWAWRR
jgi:hypothetical protein